MVLFIAIVVGGLVACNNHSGTDQDGSVNDGIKAMDYNGGLADRAFKGNQSATYTSKMEDRVIYLSGIPSSINRFKPLQLLLAPQRPTCVRCIVQYG